MKKTGISDETAILFKKFGSQIEAIKELAYCLYDIALNKRQEVNEAPVYNALIKDWLELSRYAVTVSPMKLDDQMKLVI